MIFNKNKKTIKTAVVRIAGDSGDGIQLIGSQFSNNLAFSGLNISTFPDFPAEIRAPIGTISGISGFQVQFSSENIYTPGDKVDVLIAMNPAALKSNLKDLELGSLLIINLDTFNSVNYKKANYEFNPLESDYLNNFKLIKININSILKDGLKDLTLGNKDIERSKNFFCLGILYWLYNINIEKQKLWIKEKFKNDESLLKINMSSFLSGFNYAENNELFNEYYYVNKFDFEKGIYRSVTGNTAISLGILYLKKISGLNIFYSGYPITPASDILHELSKYNSEFLTVFQAEDEISAICSCIGSSLTGNISFTGTSGPGMSLKTESINLAFIMETPLVIIDIQRAGPSTGMPTKVEQSDVLFAVYGRPGDSALPVISASSPVDCFYSIIEAARISIKFMTPVIFLSDSYIANTSELLNLSNIKNFNFDFDFLKEHMNNKNQEFSKRNANLSKKWFFFGSENNEYRTGGLEKDEKTGVISTNPDNHETLTKIRSEKIKQVSKHIIKPTIYGCQKGELLIISFGSSFGSTRQAVEILVKGGFLIGHLNIKWLYPLHDSIFNYFSNFRNVIILELNNGQFSKILKSFYSGNIIEYNKIQGQPFKVSEILFVIKNILNNNEIIINK